jgi:hypothetical protein
MNKELLEIHSNVKDWLRFAEAKNAMLIAFNGASIYGIANLPFLNKKEDLSFIDGYFSFVILLLVFSTVVCLISFVPRLKFTHLSIANKNDKENIFFFEYLGGSSPDKILTELTEKGVEDKFSEMDKDLAVQIHSLSNVARKKYSLFTIAVWITVVACATLPLALIFAGFNYKN